MVAVVVRGRMPGREGIGDVRLDVAPVVTARELIGAVVAAQIAGTDAEWAASSRLYLTDDEIAALAAAGVVRVGAMSGGPARVAEATARAVAAFQSGVFVMFAGARQVDGIDAAVNLRDGDRVVFLRLTALVGG